MARRELGERLIVSAGFFPEAGRTSPGVAIDVARSLGVDLVPHRSRVFDAELAERADAIFVFDQINYQSVAESHPTARSRLHFVGALAEHGSVFIEDPWGAPREEFELVYRRIVELIAGA